MAYIEREKAIDEIDKWLDSVGYVTVGKGLTSYGELVGCLKDTPTADVVEVVRCKDCKYAFHHPLGYIYCHRDGRNAYEMVLKRDSFCSYGERKDGE